MSNPNTSYEGVETQNISSRAHEVARAQYAETTDTAYEADASAFTRNAIGFQTLTWEVTLTDVAVNQPTTVVNITGVGSDGGAIPHNVTCFSCVAFSDGLTGTVGGTAVDLPTESGFTMRIYAAGSATAAWGDAGVVQLNSALTYPALAEGTYAPPDPATLIHRFPRPEIPSTDSYEWLNVELAWDNAIPLLISGTLIFKMVVLQSDPNNLAVDGYPTGGYSSGPVDEVAAIPQGDL